MCIDCKREIVRRCGTLLASVYLALVAEPRLRVVSHTKERHYYHLVDNQEIKEIENRKAKQKQEIPG